MSQPQAGETFVQYMSRFARAQGYVPNTQGGNNAKGSYAAIRAQASANWHASKGTVQKPKATGPKRVVAKAGTKKASSHQASEAAQFAGLCKGYDQSGCEHNPACTWMGGKVNRCQKRAGKEALASMAVQRNAANRMGAVFRGNKVRKQLAQRSQQPQQQQGGYWW